MLRSIKNAGKRLSFWCQNVALVRSAVAFQHGAEKRCVALVTWGIRLIATHALELPCTAGLSTLHLEDREIDGDARLQTHFLRKDHMTGERSGETFCRAFGVGGKIKLLFPSGVY